LEGGGVQAMTMSFSNAFLRIGISMVIVSPALFLLRGSKKAASAGAEMAH
jgi:hypothetical protein